jgi:hypothetical protein
MAFAGALPIQFLSPYTNHRTDDYGGSAKNRMRFLLAVIESCRGALGPDCALSLKIAADELVSGGLGLRDVQDVVKVIDGVGSIDWYVVIAGNNMERFARVDHWPPTPAPQGLHAKLAAGIKAISTKPVAALGRIVSPILADRLIADGTCDMVAMVRATIADPDIGRKLIQGRVSDIRPCVGNNTSCIDRTLDGGPMRCIHNSTIGREGEWGLDLGKSPKPGIIVVVGGGPAGMEAARVAAERGHRVTLLERSGELGGAATDTARQPGREELIGIVRWLVGQLEKLEVDVRLSMPATLNEIRRARPDYLVLATGARDSEPVEATPTAGVPVVSAWAVINGQAAVGRNVLVIDHFGKQLGCAVAELVADNGGKAELVTRQFHPAVDYGLTNTISTYRRLFRKGVTLTAHHDIGAINRGVVTIFNYYSGAERTIEGLDTVVIVTVPVANDDLFAELRSSQITFEPIGDCVAPRDIESAILDGHRVARAL